MLSEDNKRIVVLCKDGWVQIENTALCKRYKLTEPSDSRLIGLIERLAKDCAKYYFTLDPRVFIVHFPKRGQLVYENKGDGE